MTAEQRLGDPTAGPRAEGGRPPPEARRGSEGAIPVGSRKQSPAHCLISEIRPPELGDNAFLLL